MLGEVFGLELFGLELTEAIATLEKGGYAACVVVTLSPNSEPIGRRRVVRVRAVSGGKVELTAVCSQDLLFPQSTDD